ncbi:hypothetical protein vseg_010472 [Gypsophila vaccaria]
MAKKKKPTTSRKSLTINALSPTISNNIRPLSNTQNTTSHNTIATGTSTPVPSATVVTLEGLITPAIPPVIEPLQLDDLLVDEEIEGWETVTGKRSQNTVPLPTPVRLKLIAEDVEGELSYWKTAVVCYILGANPPFSVISGFVRRIWGKHGFDNISYLPNGLFIVHFPTIEAQQLVLNGGFHFFDNKPLILKAWSSDLPLTKQAVSTVPVWIRLRGLELKYWGQTCLKKFAGEIGEFVRPDEYTRVKSHLEYARILVEMEMNKELKYDIEFVDEMDTEKRISVEYEWLPISCKGCGGFGHASSDCRKKGGTLHMMWKKKEVAPLPQPIIQPETRMPSVVLPGEVQELDGNGSGIQRPVTYLEIARSGSRGVGISVEAVQPPGTHG